MAAECFCGCGRKVSFRWRPVNSRGREIRESIAEVKSSPGRGRKGEGREYIVEANRACDRIAEAIHGEAEADKDLEAETRALLKAHKERKAKPLFGRYKIVRR
jgi:hypothetical protein